MIENSTHYLIIRHLPLKKFSCVGRLHVCDGKMMASIWRSRKVTESKKFLGLMTQTMLLTVKNRSDNSFGIVAPIFLGL